MALVGLVRNRGPLPLEAHVEADGLRSRWSRGSAEGSYAGTWVAWATVRDADPFATPPELRLHDGRTLFVPVELRDRLIRRLWEIGVPLAHRPEVWIHLLEPFLDSGDPALRDRYDAELGEWGFDRPEVARIRGGLRRAMASRARMASAWPWYGQVDAIDTWRPLPLPGGWATRSGYARFRSWTDELADRPTGGVR